MRKLFLGSVLTLGLSACASVMPATPSAAASFDGEWNIIKVNDKAISSDSRAILVFDAQTMRITGFDGCNRVMGSLKDENQQLKGMLASTKMACMGDENRTISRAVGQAFANGAEVKVLEAGKLIELKSKDGSLTLGKRP
ncbi:META domain-containing protein [Iodobacter ciconiae]|uniref:META domain-containing protein n=1 Tax=Iodobacter ciconiae TaxID=2496266 RepID=A0A3S8ZNE8_9NEIS|nr:META domain-containing protein [Iodobacter ciconiae]AZN35087.1 META domain-containing protein [Iodobacter ciconiae]